MTPGLRFRPLRLLLPLWPLLAATSLPGSALARPITLMQAAGRVVQGKVTDASGGALPGVTVVVKGTTIGTATDEAGRYALKVPDGPITLVISSVGYVRREVPLAGSQATLNVTLVADTKSLDEVLVTGVFDKRTRMDASVAITALSARQIERVVPTSATDLLRNVPGVYVNTSRGEVNGAVYTRGLNVGGGFYYVSLQEDGLPILASPGSTATDPTFKPDGYLRADVTVARVEAVRGGTASILGANAPGGIFNYISKTGGDSLRAELRARVGLEGNGRNPYYRFDANVGGPLAAKDLTFNVGGFYRYADGAKYPGYPLSYGGQVRANVLKKYKTGSLKLYAKFLDDHTASYEFTPSVDFDNPHPAEGFSNTSSTLIQAVQLTVPSSVTGGRELNFDSRNVGRYADRAVGLNWEQQLGDTWTLTNNVRYSNKRNTLNTTANVFPFRVDATPFYGVNSAVGKFGTYSFYNVNTGASYGSVQQLPPTAAGGAIRFVPGADLNLPGAGVQPNSLFNTQASFSDIGISELIDQLTITKQLENMGFTLGGYFAQSTTTRDFLVPLARAFSTIQERPELVGIKYTNLAGQTYDFSDKNGFINYGGSGIYRNDADVRQLALFFGHTWKLSDKLNLDYGLRFENFRIDSRFSIPKVLADSPTGGVDGNPLTLYDNRLTGQNPEQSFSKNTSTLSYSAGLNYRFSNALALYGRYTQGRKSPDLGFFLDIANQQLTSNISVENQSTQMAELGFKLSTAGLNVFVTPFYTLLSNVPNFQIFQNTDAITYYAPPRQYQKIETEGLELEANYTASPHFSIRAVSIVQHSIALDYHVYVANANGPDDDVLVDLSGNYTDNVPPLMLTVTPTYTLGPLYASLTYQYMGARWANVANAFQLPAYSSFDLNLGYSVSRRMQLSASLNNLFNTYGILSWAAPGSFPASLDLQGFTRARRESNPSQLFGTLPIQPRAFYLSAIYRF